MSVSKLNEKAVLVGLKISQFTLTKEDRKISREVEQNHNTQGKAGKYQKLLVNENVMKELSTIAGRARTFHYENTLPWGDEGSRLLPAKRYFHYVTEMQTFASEFLSKVEEIVLKLPDIVTEARTRLGDMFNQSDYPSENEMRNKYALKYNIYPVPDREDFRINLNEGEINHMKAEMEENLKEIQANATKIIWGKLYKVVHHMAEKLKDEDATFHKTMIENIKNLCDILPDLNLSDDENLEEMRKEVSEKLTEFSPDTLREEKETRKEVAETAEQIAKRIEAYM